MLLSIHSSLARYVILPRIKSLLLLPGLFLFFLISSCTREKKPEILLVGVFHEIPDSLSCNWKAPLSKLIQYQPDQVCVEYVAPWDTASLPFFLGDDYREKWDSVMIAWEGKLIQPRDSVNKYSRLLKEKYDDSIRYHLWKYYHLHADIGNRDYQTYLLHQRIKGSGQLPDTSSALGKNFWKNYQRTLTHRGNGEYFNLVFPLAQAMKIDYIYPTDDKTTYTRQSEAWGKFYEQMTGTSTMNKIDSSWKAYTDNEKKQLLACNGLIDVNTRVFVQHTDFLQAHIADESKNEYFIQYRDIWYQRNQSIANRIIAAVNESKAERMAVFYGNIHVFPIKKFLEEKGFTVKLLDDL